MQNILKALLRNKIFLLFTIFLLANNFSFAQINKPVSKAKVDSLKQSEEKYWYADKIVSEKQKKAEPMPSEPRVNEQKSDWKLSKTFETIAKILVWGILGVAILVAIYVILKNLKGFKFKTNTAIIAKIEEITDDFDIEEISETDFNNQIAQCIRDKNYRLATRFYYLWVVKTLHETNLIAFNIDKTNQDYVKELSKKAIFSKERLSHFIQCTNYYEYLWFGNFNVTESAFFNIENTFKAFINKKA